MIIPLNNHVVIEPVVHEEFISSTKGTYEEIGVVITAGSFSNDLPYKKGDKVYFDSWLASKYPDGKGGFYWLVKMEDIRGYETIPELTV